LQSEMVRIEQSDVRLSRSLQAAAVHNWLIANDTQISAALPAESSPPSAGEPVVEAVPVPLVSGKKPEPDAVPPAPLAESSPLSDVQLARRLTLPPGDTSRLVVRPLIDPGQVGGTTIDLRLGTEWETLRTSRFRSLDPSDDPAEVSDLLNESVEEFRLTAGEAQGLVLHPGELLLALTLEYLSLPPDLWGQLEGRSTWARVGLQVHATAGMVDAGFKGFLTLELQNTGRLPIVLYPGLRVGQMAFFPVSNIARPYSAKAGAAYTDQAKARTAFTAQHEHKARHMYIAQETQLESERSQRLSPSIE
jgi:dCTP deaminase